MRMDKEQVALRLRRLGQDFNLNPIKLLVALVLAALFASSCMSGPVTTGPAGDYCREMQELWDMSEEGTLVTLGEVLNRRVDDTNLHMDEEWRKQASTLLRKRMDEVDQLWALNPPFGGWELQQRARGFARAERAFMATIGLGIDNPPNLLDQSLIDSRIWELKAPTEDFEAEFEDYCGWDIAPQHREKRSNEFHA